MKNNKRNIISFISMLILISFFINCGGSKEVIKEEVIKEKESPIDTLNTEVKKELAIDKGIVPVLNKANFDEASPSISPDGNYIIYQGRKVNENWDIYLYDVRLDSSTIFYSSTGNDESPKFSKDGSMIVFTSDKDGFEYDEGNKSRDIFLVRLNNQKDLVKITDSEGDNWFPNFYDNDNKILFSSNVNDSEQNYYDEKVSLFSYNLKNKLKVEELAYIDYKNLSVYSPNLKAVAYTDIDKKLIIANISNKNNVIIVSDDDSFSGAAFFSNDSKKLFYQNYNDLKYTINIYDIEKDQSSVLIDNYKNSRAPVVYKNKLYFHSNNNGDDYNIYMKEMKE